MMSRQWAAAMDANGFTMAELGALALLLGGSDDSITGDILHLIAKADHKHRVALSYAFPRELAAYQLWVSIAGPNGGSPGFAQFYDLFHADDPPAPTRPADAATTITCPDCGAGPGQRCDPPRGVIVHRARADAWYGSPASWRAAASSSAARTSTAPVSDRTHPGIELRVTTSAGVVAQCDSDFAHFAALFAGTGLGEWRTILEHYVVQADDDQTSRVASIEDTPKPDAPLVLKIELRPVELADVEAPDDAAALLDDSGQIFPDAT